MNESRSGTMLGNNKVKIVTMPFDGWPKMNFKKRYTSSGWTSPGGPVAETLPL